MTTRQWLTFKGLSDKDFWFCLEWMVQLIEWWWWRRRGRRMRRMLM